jgi:hypothetical protein
MSTCAEGFLPAAGVAEPVPNMVTSNSKKKGRFLAARNISQ